MDDIHNVPTAQSFPGAADEEVALARLFELTVVVGEFMQRGLAERGLTRARATVLWELTRGGAVTQSRIAKAVGSTPRNVTGLIDALEAGGFVTRGPHPTDRRATLVALTEQGTAVAASLTRDYGRGAVRLFGDVPEADLAAFIRTVDHVLDRLRPTITPTNQEPA